MILFAAGGLLGQKLLEILRQQGRHNWTLLFLRNHADIGPQLARALILLLLVPQSELIVLEPLRVLFVC